MAYVAYVTALKNVRKHPNADRLQLADCFGNTVVVGLDYHEGQVGVYFPVDGQLSPEFCKVNDLVRRRDENGNACGGYLDPDKRNIKAMKLRGEKSDGLFLPLTAFAGFTKISDMKVGDTIDVLNGVEICRKYIPKTKNRTAGVSRGNKVAKANFAPTFYQHVDTQQLAYNLDAFKSGDIVELTLKMHGTSGRTGYLPLIVHHQSLFDKIFNRPGREVKAYGYVTGTRRVVLDDNHDGGFYDDNTFRRKMAEKFEGKLHKGEVVYYEIVGFVNENTPIMASVKNSKIKDKEFTKQYGPETVFSYGCDPNGDFEWHNLDDSGDIESGTMSLTEAREYGLALAPRCEIYVYRMTMVNDDGDVVEMSPDQMRYRCAQMGIKTVPVFERFIIPEKQVIYDDGHFVETESVNPGEYVLRKVEQYFDGPDPVGKTHIREGVVARIVNRPEIAVYKHKNFSFKVLEGIAKDEADAPDMEEAQDEVSI